MIRHDNIVLSTNKTFSDPALPKVTSVSSTGGLQEIYLTPDVLASQIESFYRGNFSEIARTWEITERRDSAITTAKQKRYNKVLSEIEGWEIYTVDESAQALQQQSLLYTFFEEGIYAEDYFDPTNAGSLRKLIFFLLDSIGKQYSFQSKEWIQDGSLIKLKTHFIPLWYFNSKDKVFYLSDNPNGFGGNPINPEEWLIANTGKPLMESAQILSLFKRLPVRQLVHVLEKWGNPSIYAESNSKKGSPERQEILEGLSAIIGGWSACFSAGDKIQELKVDNKTSTMHMPWIEYCDRELVNLWLGNSLSTISQSGSGTLAGNAQQDDQFQMTSNDCQWITDLINTQITQQFLKIRFGKNAKVLAKFRLRRRRDAATEIQKIQSAINFNIPVPLSYVRDVLNIPAPQEGEEVLQTSPKVVAGPMGPKGEPGESAVSSTSETDVEDPEDKTVEVELSVEDLKELSTDNTSKSNSVLKSLLNIFKRILRWK